MGRGDPQRAGRSGGLANSFAYRYRILKGGAKRRRRVVEKTGLRPELRQTLGLRPVERGPRREKRNAPSIRGIAQMEWMDPALLEQERAGAASLTAGTAQAMKDRV